MKVFKSWICNEIRPISYCLLQNRKPQMANQELKWSGWIRIKLYSSIYSKRLVVEVCFSTPRNRMFWIRPICLIHRKQLQPLDSQKVWRDGIIRGRRHKSLNLLVHIFLEYQHPLNSTPSSARLETKSHQSKQNEMAHSIKPNDIHTTIAFQKLVTSPIPSSTTLELPFILPINQPKWPNAA